MLKYIKTTKCPECGCEEIYQEKWQGNHSSGKREEYRIFRCGQEVYFSPNFDKEYVCKYDVCKNSITYRKQREEVDALKTKINMLINGVTLPPSFINNMLWELRR